MTLLASVLVDGGMHSLSFGVCGVINTFSLRIAHETLLEVRRAACGAMEAEEKASMIEMQQCREQKYGPARREAYDPVRDGTIRPQDKTDSTATTELVANCCDSPVS